MATHYEAVQRYLADHGWESKPTGNVQEADKTLEIQTYLNSLLTLNATTPRPSHSTSAVTKETTSRKRKRVYFELEMEDAPPLEDALALQAPNPPRPLINAITNRRTFPAGVTTSNSTITVPWPPPGAEINLVEWYGTLPILHHELNQALLAHCHPWTTWIHRPPDPSPVLQAWFTTNIYSVIELAAKFDVLATYNAALCSQTRKAFSSNNHAMSMALCTAKKLSSHISASSAAPSPNSPSPPPSFPLSLLDHRLLLPHLTALHAAHARLLYKLRSTDGFAGQILRLVSIVAQRLRELQRSASSTTPSPARTVAGEVPAFLEALAGVEAGVTGFVKGLAGGLRVLFKEAGEVVEIFEKRLVDVGKGVEKGGGEKGVDDKVLASVRGLREWYGAAWRDVGGKGVVGKTGEGQGKERVTDEEVWERVKKVCDGLRRAEEGYRELAEGMRRLAAGGRVMMGRGDKVT